MGKNVLMVAAAPFLLLSAPLPVWAKPAVVIVQPEGSQVISLESGAQIITSELPGSIVVMRTPEPFEGGRTRVFFTFVNNGQVPVNVGPENITSAQIAVVSYDKLMAEQKSSEGWRKFAEVLTAVGNSLSATDAGRQSTVTSYGGYANCGYGCGGTYTGSAVSNTYSPYAAQQARLQADAQNRAAAAAMHLDHASARGAIAANLRTTTVMPGHYITGMLTFEVPRAVRRAKQASPMALYIRVGSDVHVLKGYTGAIGTTPPPPAVATATAAIPKGTSSAASSKPVMSAQDAYARAEALYYGRGVQQDFAAAASLCRQAADQGDANARYFLGTMYYQGKGVPQDFATAAVWTRKAADQGLASAQYTLGVLYRDGQGVPQDLATAAYLFRNAAAQGLADAQYNLGVLYQNGQGAPQDFAIAASWYRKAADQGLAEAQYILGMMYQRGRGVPQMFPYSAGWYRKAAEQGHAEAQYSLGSMYQIGQGVTRDAAAAKSWYRKSADQGHAQAQISLKWME